jgi:predicted PurR-regulated permease PerM
VLELNPVLLFLALFIGERVAGLLGVFLAIPIAGMIAAWMHSMQVEQSVAKVGEGGRSLEETPADR